MRPKILRIFTTAHSQNVVCHLLIPMDTFFASCMENVGAANARSGYQVLDLGRVRSQVVALGSEESVLSER
ncbi:MAG: hypothetical protein WA951_04975 [Leeuwenhoekiella sp.]